MGQTSRSEALERFNEVSPSYHRLGLSVQRALSRLLGESGLEVHDVTHRIKTFDSLWGKIQRKGYSDPFREIEDICGLRIICYYTHDLNRIGQIIESEFDVNETLDKSSVLGFDRFGYRSNHFIAEIKSSWLTTPDYRGLDNLRFEIQVRTILMHAWADIEHNLAYKSEIQVPAQFRRKLSQLSALIEMADDQFDFLRHQIAEYQIRLAEGQAIGELEVGIPLDLDTLQAFLDSTFGGRERDRGDTSELFEEMHSLGISIADISDGLTAIGSDLENQEREYFLSLGEDIGISIDKMSQTGIVRHILDVTNDVYYESRSDEFPPEVHETIKNQRIKTNVT